MTWDEQFQRGLESFFVAETAELSEDLEIALARVLMVRGRGSLLQSSLGAARDLLVRRTNSPLKAAFFIALLGPSVIDGALDLVIVDPVESPQYSRYAWLLANDDEWVPLDRDLVPIRDQYRWLQGPGGILTIELQKQIEDSQYRADFLLTLTKAPPSSWGNDRRFEALTVAAVIECDGHDYHERTKEQAARDRSRDRFVQQCGLNVLRYTGSEIYENPLACAADAVDTLCNRLRQLRHERWYKGSLQKTEKSVR